MTHTCTARDLQPCTVLLHTVKQQSEEGMGEERDVHMRARSFCNLELYVRDTVFQASIYRSIHMAIHFCKDMSREVKGGSDCEMFSEGSLSRFSLPPPARLSLQ